MERRFAIRGSVSGSVRSTTGFAEGCSLSVCAMVAANHLICTWMTHKAPLARLISFVDNLELFASDPHVLMQSVVALENILELLDLQVDKKKTYLWSTEGSFRKKSFNMAFKLRQRPEMWVPICSITELPPTSR